MSVVGNMVRCMSASKRNRIVAQVYSEWAAEQAGKVPLTEYAQDGKSQSAEGVEILGASADAQADLKRRTDAALIAAGLPVDRFA